VPQLALPSDIPLADHAIDRAAHRRRDADWLKAAYASDRVRVLLMRQGQPLVQGDAPPAQAARIGASAGPPAPLLWLGPQAAMLSPKGRRVFLGMTRKDDPVFALEVPDSFSLAASPIAGLGQFQDFRAAAGAMDAFDAGLAATARALFEWRRRHGFCANCGTPVEDAEAGWKTSCPECKAEHFPRVDPVAIMLAVRGDKCLMGRQAAWPPGFWSCLAGFVEPGETFEQAAARELFEEAGVRAASRAEYLFGQPWPFPSSLMVGLILEAESEEIDVDPAELEAAQWFTRDEARAMLARAHPTAYAPPPLAIAHHVLKAWVGRG
jgi:NAD+ diphosphatase